MQKSTHQNTKSHSHEPKLGIRDYSTRYSADMLVSGTSPSLRSDKLREPLNKTLVRPEKTHALAHQVLRSEISDYSDDLFEML